ncbi:MAG: hypothetical protein KCHDKBKB_02404 [Elusimicrobia bacterium]|nr:hypothetical protein [Elusimicrobiota bacterium]
MISRILSQRLKSSKKSVLLLGPRQVGKSTVCRALNPKRIINLADESIFLSYSKDAAKLLRELRADREPGLIVIDEIQRVPALLNSVQAFLDEGGLSRFILTGSSARKLKRGGANLLPGRIILEHLDPLNIWELKEEFELEKILLQGSLPGIYTDPTEGLQVLNTYAQVYIREEIQAESLTKNIGAYARFLDAAAEASGDWLNYSKFSSDAELSKTSVRRFFDILTETLIAFRLPAFEPRQSHRRISQRDRYIFFDIGVRNAILGLAGQILPNIEKGKLFEQWFILQCFSYAHSFGNQWKFSSFRTDTGLEVDLIIDTGPHLIAAECKYSRNVSETDLRGLRAFSELAHKPVKKYLICLADQPQKFPKDEVAINYKDFLLKEVPTL